MTTEVKTQKLAAVVPSLHDALMARAATSSRLQHYPAVATLAEELITRFRELNPSELELSASMSMETKQEIADQLDEWFDRAVRPAYQMKVSSELPEWLQTRKRKQAEYFAEVFAGIQELTDEVRAFIDAQSPTLTIAQARERYAEWQAIYDAQLNKDENLQKIAEVVDIKKSLIGLMWLMDMQNTDINEVIYGQ